MGRLLIDITELVSWRGKLTGVTRVINELSYRFETDGRSTFVGWDDKTGQYFKAEYKKYPPNEHLVEEVIVRPSIGHALRSTVKEINKRSKIASKTTQVSRKVVRKIYSMGTAKPLLEKIDPRADDVLLIMADWHSSESFIRYLKQLKNNRTRIIQFSYDMLPIIAPQYSGHSTKKFTMYVDEVYPMCDLILSISECTKEDIISRLKKKRTSKLPKIEVIRLGDDYQSDQISKPPASQLPKALRNDNNFLLCVGTVEARKNHVLIYYAYKLAHQRQINLPRVVIAGRLGWLANDIYEIMVSDPDVSDKFVFLQDADDDLLSWLYDNAKFSIYPSFYEGWGLPIAESVARGVPCIASSSSSMPEVAGDLIKYFSPYSPEELLDAMVELLKPATINNAKNKLKSFKPTKWDQTYASVKAQIGEIGV